ncbi:COMM domain-containing protein 2 isoform X1 [Gallus gallus]|uniref:COMM domain-containing protein 2 isoform X1 n=1 Tax=Gallus gallus TaxID=9031 RepID=UPI001F032537|nr:COMM domain-containing protein 2 isoform X1 [Gallus gallus]
MLLVLSEEQKAHLGCLPRVGGAAIGELGYLAVELLRRGAAPKACEAVARKLNAGVDTVQHGVEGLMYLLTESSKLMISEMDFQDSIHVLGFSDELNKLLLQLYLDNRKEIRSILGELAPKLPSYHSLEWRLDVQLASRSLRQQIKPAVTMKLHLNDNEDLTTQVLQTDPSTLLHLIQQLEQALGEMKTNHYSCMCRSTSVPVGLLTSCPRDPANSEARCYTASTVRFSQHLLAINCIGNVFTKQQCSML